MLKTSKRLVLLPNYLDPSQETVSLAYEKGFPNARFELPQRILYHYTSFENAKLILRGRTLKFASPETFNDPFDLHEGLVDFKCKGNSSIRNWVHMFLPKGTDKEKRNLADTIKAEGIPAFEQRARNFFQELKKVAGICCFSKESDVSLMWSHYGNRHTGICFGFEFHPVGVDTDVHMAFRAVNYIDKIKPVDYYSNMPDAFTYWITGKSTVWEYEKEVRAFINNRRGNDLFPFTKSCLKEVYFGCRTTPSQQKEVLDLLQEHQYNPNSIRKMVIDDATFSVKAIAL